VTLPHPDPTSPDRELEAAFLQAERNVHALPKRPDTGTLLKLYGLYKQGSEGDVPGERPGGFDFVGAAKYDAWAQHRSRPRLEAKRAYVDLVRSITGG